MSLKLFSNMSALLARFTWNICDLIHLWKLTHWYYRLTYVTHVKSFSSSQLVVNKLPMKASLKEGIHAKYIKQHSSIHWLTNVNTKVTCSISGGSVTHSLRPEWFAEGWGKRRKRSWIIHNCQFIVLHLQPCGMYSDLLIHKNRWEDKMPLDYQMLASCL